MNASSRIDLRQYHRLHSIVAFAARSRFAGLGVLGMALRHPAAINCSTPGGRRLTEMIRLRRATLHLIAVLIGLTMLANCSSDVSRQQLGENLVALSGEGGRMVEINTMPVPGAVITSVFGERRGTRLHQGIDYAAPTGTPIYAAASGCIQQIGNRRGYGRYILLRHDSVIQTVYAHMSAYASGLQTGRCLNRGDLIGRVGTSGNATGPHLHFELLYQGSPIDPLSS